MPQKSSQFGKLAPQYNFFLNPYENERLLTSLFEQHAPEVVGNNYLILGTVDHDFWKQGTKTPHTVQRLVDNLHDFKQVLTFKPASGWIEKERPSGKRQPANPARFLPG